MLPRVLEPEVMDTAEDAADYDSMDHAEVNRRFVDDLLAARLNFDNVWPGVQVLDVGTGTALIPIELAGRGAVDRLQIIAIDLAEEMLKVGRRHVAAAGLTGQIELRLCDAKHIGCAPGTFEAVVSNSIVHHIPEPAAVFAEMWRLVKPGGLLFVRDLLRPESAAGVEKIVQMYAGAASPRQQQLFRQSLHAALTMDEIVDLLEPLGIGRDAVRETSDRHWTVTARKPRPFQLRPETASDQAAIFAVHAAAFPTTAEAELVDRLRAAGQLQPSIVAELEGRIVGHVGFSPVTAENGVQGVGLAPVAVLPDHRRQGIAAELVRAGLATAHAAGYGWTVVLGEPHYYQRFGFRPAAEFGLYDEYGGGAAFQALELTSGRLPRDGGLVRYAPEFAAFT